MNMNSSSELLTEFNIDNHNYKYVNGSFNRTLKHLYEEIRNESDDDNDEFDQSQNYKKI
jgi:hypothetical protein